MVGDGVFKDLGELVKFCESTVVITVSEKKDREDDALYATRMAVEEDPVWLWCHTTERLSLATDSTGYIDVGVGTGCHPPRRAQFSLGGLFFMRLCSPLFKLT